MTPTKIPCPQFLTKPWRCKVTPCSAGGVLPPVIAPWRNQTLGKWWEQKAIDRLPYISGDSIKLSQQMNLRKKIGNVNMLATSFHIRTVLGTNQSN